ncbi:MAG: ABC transporter permease [Bacteroidales bacterium]|nr:ABC transporter permease [Bacteroidales bacterium]
MGIVISAFTIGLILAALTMGMLISFRMLRFTDITVDGSLTLGAAVAAVCIVNGWSPWLATLLAMLSGAVAGMFTGLLYTRFKIQMILSGILMMTALYSINLRIMGRSNIPLLNTDSVSNTAETLITGALGGAARINVFGWPVPVTDVSVFVTALLLCVVTGIVLRYFLLTHLGTALRATGNNPQMVRAQGINDHLMTVLGLSLANGLVALAGALLAQYQGFADVQMGIGMMVWGLASIIIGEALVGTRSIGVTITGAILGTVFFRLLIAIALRWGLNPNDLKLVTAAFVFIALVAPIWITSLRKTIWGGLRHA